MVSFNVFSIPAKSFPLHNLSICCEKIYENRRFLAPIKRLLNLRKKTDYIADVLVYLLKIAHGKKNLFL